jgi:hypothetical protein
MGSIRFTIYREIVSYQIQQNALAQRTTTS